MLHARLHILPSQAAAIFWQVAQVFSYCQLKKKKKCPKTINVALFCGSVSICLCLILNLIALLVSSLMSFVPLVQYYNARLLLYSLYFVTIYIWKSILLVVWFW